MKIAMMTRWNVPTGLASHAEPVGRAWLEMGHDLIVFAPKGLDSYLMYHADEPFVHRCYMMDIWEERKRPDYFFDPRPFLEEDYEVFLVEDAEITPMPELLGIFPQIKKKARTVLVVHEVGLPNAPNWYKFDWDAIVCFDARYKEFVARAFPEQRIAIIPFPCHPPAHGDKVEARRRLALPLDREIVLAYGFNVAENHTDLLPIMERLSRDYPLLFLMVSHHGIRPASLPAFAQFREEMPDDDRLYGYLFASDAYVYYVRPGDEKTRGVGVSSSVAFCLGAGRPVLAPSYCNFFDFSGKEVIKYGGLEELEQRLREVFGCTELVKESLAAAETYAVRNSGREVAARFIELFERIRREPATAVAGSRA